MGIQDRQYFREDPRRNPYGTGVRDPSGATAVGAMRLWSITTWLIIVNIAVFVIDGLLMGAGIGYIRLLEFRGRLFPIDAMGPLEFWGYFSRDTAIQGLQLWRWITFQFLHAGLGHIIGNMLGLYFFGPMIESRIGSRRFLAFYLICGICGPLVYLLFGWANILQTTGYTPLVGASAGVFGILIAAAITAPRMRIMLIFPPVPLELRTLAWALIVIAAYSAFTQGYNAGGEAAHLGGAAAGYLLIRHPRWLNWAEPDWLRLKAASLRRRRLGSSKMKYHGWR